MGVLRMMKETRGDTTVSWDPTKPEEVARAKAVFESWVGGGQGAAFVVERDENGKARRGSRQLRQWDAAAGEIALMPQMVGG